MRRLLCMMAFFTLPGTLIAQSFSLNSILAPLASGPVYTFSGASGDTVNNLRFCNLGSSCNAGICTGQSLVINSGTPLVSGQAYSFSGDFFKSYLQANNLNAAGNYYIGLKMQSTHLKCAGSTKYCSASVDSASAPLCVLVTYNGTTVSGMTQQDNGAVNLTPSIQRLVGQYVYLGQNFSAAHPLLCQVAANGAINSCASAGGSGWNEPLDISVATVGATQYAYVVDNQNISQCGVATSGGFSSCAVLTPSSVSPTAFVNPQAIAVLSMRGTQYAYVSDSNTYTYRCGLNSDGTLSSCLGRQLSSGASSTRGFAAALLSGGQYLYVADPQGGVYKCSNGDLTACNNIYTPSPGDEPTAITVANIAGTYYAYITDLHNVVKCTVSNTDGSLSSCAATSSGVSAPRAINIAMVDGTQHAYITSGSSIYYCDIATVSGAGQGDLSNCSASSASLDVPWGITSAFVAGG